MFLSFYLILYRLEKMSVSDGDSFNLIELPELICAGEINGSSTECAQELKFLQSVLEELSNQRRPEQFRRPWGCMMIEETLSYDTNMLNLMMYRDSCASFLHCACPENTSLVRWIEENFEEELGCIYITESEF